MSNQLNIESAWTSSIKIIEDFELQKKMQLIEKENLEWNILYHEKSIEEKKKDLDIVNLRINNLDKLASMHMMLLQDFKKNVSASKQMRYVFYIWAFLMNILHLLTNPTLPLHFFSGLGSSAFSPARPDNIMQKYALLFKHEKTGQTGGEGGQTAGKTGQVDLKSSEFSPPPPPLKRYRSDFFDEES